MKILILTGDAGESQEIYYPKFRLEEEGWQVDIAAPERRTFLSVVHDFEPGFDTFTEKPGYRVQADVAFDDVIAENYDALILPGGRAPEYLRNRANVLAIIRHFIQSKKPIGATCHAPLLLIVAGSIRGRNLACYPDLEPDIRAAGGNFVDQDVVIDDNLITTRAWPDSPAWMREFVRALKRLDSST